MDWTRRLLLTAILLAYAVVGVLYAVYTPPWQVPDEPAHYNYVRALAQERALPVIEAGDYDQTTLDLLRDEGFPPYLPVDSVTYEDHQPPLYYLLAAPVYLLFDGALLPLRLFSLAVGLVVLLAAYGVVGALFPDRPLIAFTATAFVAFVPQHLAMMAGVNNDALAEALVGVGLWMAVRYLQRETARPRFLLGWGVVLGAALLTKTTAYVALPVALVAIGLRARREGRSLRWAAAQASWLLLPAVLLTAPWLGRNAAVYGWGDPLGLARHNAVVVGQTRTAEWLAVFGWGGLLARMVRTTFQSFWGQFGWMAVPLQVPVYLVLLAFCGILAVGFFGWVQDRRRPRQIVEQRQGLLLAVSALLTLALYLWYNLTFVQHQGRYLFPGLIPLAAAAAVGLEWLLKPRVARGLAVGLGVVGGLLVLWFLMGGEYLLIPVVTAFMLAGLFALAALWGGRGRVLATAVLAAGLVVLDLHALFGAIVPTLAR